MKRSFGVSVLGLALAVAAAFVALLATPAGAQVRRATRPQVDRPDGPVWEVIRYNCISCHGIDDYAFFALDRAGWQSLIGTKHAGMEDVALSDDERTLLLNWLVEQFGPDSTPFPRNYVPPKITRFFSDPEAYRLLNQRCTACHGMDPTDDARFSGDRWRVILIEMRERGTQLTDEELETLVEWLGRVKGINLNQ